MFICTAIMGLYIQKKTWCRKSGGTTDSKAALASFVLFGISLKKKQKKKKTENAQS